jgi:hypothetical protein
MIADVRVSVFTPSASGLYLRDVAATDLIGGRIRYEDTPAGNGAGELSLGLRFEEVYQRGYWSQLNIVEISTGDDKLQHTIATSGFTAGESAAGAVAKIYVSSTLAYDPAQGEDTQQLYLWDGLNLRMGMPVVNVATDATGPYCAVAAPSGLWPAQPAVTAFGIGAIVGRRRYAGLVRAVDKPNEKFPKATITLGPVSSAFDEVQDGYTIGALANQDVTSAIALFLTKNASRWPHLNVAAANFAAATGLTFSGSRQQASVGAMVTDALNAISSGDRWVVRVGHDRTPRLIRLYTQSTNTYTYSVSLNTNGNGYDPVSVDFREQDASGLFNAVQAVGDIDPATQQPVSAIVSDAGSIALLQRQIDGAPISNSAWKTVAQCAAAAQAALNQNSIAKATGSCRVYTRNDFTPNQLPQGLANGDVVRGVQCLTLTHIDGTGTVDNLVADSEGLLTSASLARWTFGQFTIGTGIGLGGYNVWLTALGTGSPSTGQPGLSDVMQVFPGTWTASADIDAHTVTAGAMTVSVVNVANTVTYGSLSGGAGSSSHLVGPVVIPAGVTQVRLRLSTTGATITAGQQAAFARLQLQYGQYRAYQPNYAAPNPFGLVSSVETTIDIPTLDRWQDVHFAPIEPDWNAAVQQQGNAQDVQRKTNTAPGAGIGSYSFSADAYPPTYAVPPAALSLVLSIPACSAIFGAGTTPVAVPAKALTLPASATSWIYLAANGTWSTQPTSATQAGLICYGYATTNATGVIGFYGLAPIGVALGEIARPVSSSTPVITGTAGTPIDKSATTYDQPITFSANTNLATWKGITTIAWSYRQHGTTTEIPLPRSDVTGAGAGGGGSPTTGTITIPGLPIDPSATWDLIGRYVNGASGTPSALCVAVTTNAHTSSTVGTPAGSLPQVPAGTTPAPVYVSRNVLGYYTTSNVLQYQITFTMPVGQTPPGGTLSGTAPWAVSLNLLRAVHSTTTWELAGTLPCNGTGNYIGTWTVPKGLELYDFALQIVGVNSVSNVSAVLDVQPSGTPRRKLGGGHESFPSATTFTNAAGSGVPSGSITGYTGAGSASPVATIAVSAAINLPGGVAPLATYLYETLVMVRPAGATDWTVGNTYQAGAVPSTVQTVVPAGPACDIGLAFVDWNGLPTAVYVIATSAAQQISGTSLGSVGSELVDNGGFEAVVSGVPTSWYVQSNPVPALFTFSADPTTKVSGTNSGLVRVNSSATIPNGTTAIAIQSNPLALPANSRQISQSQMLGVAKNANPPAGVSFTADSFLRYYPTLADVTAGTNQVGADVSIQSLAPGVGFTSPPTSTLVPPAGAGYALVFIRVTAVNTGAPVSTGANLYCDARWDNVSVIPAVMSGDVPPGQWGRGHLKPISGSPVFPITDAVVGTDGRIVYDLNHTAVQSTIASTPGADGLYTKPGMIAGRHLLGASSSDTAAVADSSGRVLIGRHAADVQLAQQRNYISDGRFIQGNYANNYGWTAYGPATMSNTGGAYTANGVTYSMPTVSYTGSFGGFYRLLRVKPGQTYTYACLGALLSGSAGTALRVLISNVGSTTQYNGSATAPAGTAGALYTAGAGASAVPLQTTTTLTWVPIIGTFTVPSGVSLIWFMVEAFGSSAGGSFSFFLPMFHEGGKTQDYVDGAPYDGDSNVTTSSHLNNQGSIAPFTTDFALHTSQSGTSPNITMSYWVDGGTSGASVHFYRSDGSILPVPNAGTSGSPWNSVSSLTSATNVYFLAYWNVLASTWTITTSLSQFTAAQQQPGLTDGYQPSLVSRTTNSVSAGGGGGTIGGCPQADEPIECRRDGVEMTLPARDLRVGDELRDLAPGAWNRVNACGVLPAVIYEVAFADVDARTVRVDASHLFVGRDGRWVNVMQLEAGAVLRRAGGGDLEVRSVARLGWGEMAHIDCENHRYLFDKTSSHNVKAQ